MKDAPMTIASPGIYKMPLQDYIDDPAPEPSVSTSTAMALLTQSALHAKLQHPRLNPNLTKEDSARADLGTIAHAVLLEGNESNIALIEADDWRKKETKEKRDAARAEGKTPILKKDYDAVQGMVEAAQFFMMGSDLCEDWLSAMPEQTIVWKDTAGVWCRSRPDKLTPDHKIYFDYKTTASAHPKDFMKVVVNQGYDLQQALGVRGVQHVTGVPATVVFLVQEIEPPYVCSLITLSPQFLTIADERLQLAMEKWRRCLSTNQWPGYADRVATIDPPGWYGLEDEL